MSFLIWSRPDAGAAERVLAREPLVLSSDDGRLAPLQDEDLAAAVVLTAARVTPDVVAAVFVPDTPRTVVRRDGLALRAGMHLLRHRAELTVGSRTYWVAEDRSAAETTYDPALHGEDLVCHLTRAPLTAGELIVVCPGGGGWGVRRPLSGLGLAHSNLRAVRPGLSGLRISPEHGGLVAPGCPERRPPARIAPHHRGTGVAPCLIFASTASGGPTPFETVGWSRGNGRLSA